MSHEYTARTTSVCISSNFRLWCKSISERIIIFRNKLITIQTYFRVNCNGKNGWCSTIREWTVPKHRVKCNTVVPLLCDVSFIHGRRILHYNLPHYTTNPLIRHFMSGRRLAFLPIQNSISVHEVTIIEISKRNNTDISCYSNVASTLNWVLTLHVCLSILWFQMFK